MRPISDLMSVLRPYTSNASLMLVRDSCERLINYDSLRKSRAWQPLQEACLQDIQRAEGYADRLIGDWREYGALAANLRRAVEVLKGALTEAERSRPKAIAPEANPYIESIRDLLAKERLLPNNYGRPVVFSANLLVHLESAALTNLVQAELRHKSPGVDKPELVDKIVESFWRNPEVGGVSARFFAYRRALTGLLEEIYFGVLSDRRSLPGKFRNVMAWVRQHLVGAVRLQSAVSLLLKHPANETISSTVVVVGSLSIEIGMLIREMIASYLAAQIALLDFYGIKLSRDAAETLSRDRARSTPFDSGWSIGKRAAIDRLHSLSVGMRVSVRGVLQKADFMGEESDGQFIGELKEFAGPATIRIIAPFDLLSHGLVEGCHVRVSGFIRAAGSPGSNQRHIEIEELHIHEFYAENWKIAFQSLSAPSFGVWPANYHVAFQGIPVASFALGQTTTKGGIATALTGCLAELAELTKAHQTLIDAEYDVAVASAGVIVGGIAAILSGGIDIALEAVAALALAQAIHKLNEAQSDYHAAEMAFFGCTGIAIGGGGSPIGVDPDDLGNSFDSFDPMGSLGAFDSFGSFGSLGSLGEDSIDSIG